MEHFILKHYVNNPPKRLYTISVCAVRPPSRPMLLNKHINTFNATQRQLLLVTLILSSVPNRLFRATKEPILCHVIDSVSVVIERTGQEKYKPLCSVKTVPRHNVWQLLLKYSMPLFTSLKLCFIAGRLFSQPFCLCR